MGLGSGTSGHRRRDGARVQTEEPAMAKCADASVLPVFNEAHDAAYVLCPRWSDWYSPSRRSHDK